MHVTPYVTDDENRPRGKCCQVPSISPGALKFGKPTLLLLVYLAFGFKVGEANVVVAIWRVKILRLHGNH